MIREKRSISSSSLVLNSIKVKMNMLGFHYQRFVLLRRLLDWKFVKKSVVVGAGSTFARMLGLLFWLVLARFLKPDDVGFVRYSITMATIITIASATSPTSIARFIAANHDNKLSCDRYFTNGLVGVAILLAFSLFISAPVIWLLHALNLGTIICAFGLTAFFSYFSVVRGLSNAWKMGLAYFISNSVQILALLVVFGFFRLHTTTLALTIYGLTYFSPLVVEAIKPMPLRFRPSLISKAVLLELGRFAVPLVLSNGVYTIWFGTDVLLIENINPHAAGIYVAAKTIATAFSFVPAVITVVLMPHVAAQGLHRSKRYAVGAILTAFLLCLLGLLIVCIWGSKLVIMTFGRAYANAYLPLLILSVGMCFYSIYVILEAFMVGHGRPGLVVKALLIALVSTGVTGLWLTPRMGIVGASLSFTIGAFLSTMVIFLTTWRFVSKRKN